MREVAPGRTNAQSMKIILVGGAAGKAMPPAPAARALPRAQPVNFALARHIDTDEASAANVQTGAHGSIDGIPSEG
jgi:hypothetical protein